MADGLADRLIEDGVPFVLATGYIGSSIPTRLRDVPRIEKPFDAESILHSLQNFSSS